VVALATTALYLLAGVLLLAVSHLWTLAIVALLPARRKTALGSYQPKFIVVVPAHNEEKDLPALLASLSRLDYPLDRYQVWVVADNCTDRTALIAAEAGAYCIERADPAHVGKGYALQAAFSHAMASDADGVVVIDADTTVSAGLLTEFARRIMGAPAALQASDRMATKPGLWSVWLSIENLLEERLFYGARERLGCPTLLRGNGMCFSLEALRLAPFHCFSITEDVEYTVRLLRAGVRPRFVPEAAVLSDSPATLAQIAQQRGRWTTGHFRVALREAPRLFLLGLARRDPGLCEFAAAMLITSKSALAGLAGIGLAGAGLLHWSLGLDSGPFWCLAAVLALISAYFLTGLVLYRPSARQALGLAGLPLLLAYRLAIHVRAALSYRSARWVRTARG
jgi:1,2-diacylglycerol 3-beta-glucosyltransferase